jgi:hypothetical protein
MYYQKITYQLEFSIEKIIYNSYVPMKIYKFGEHKLLNLFLIIIYVYMISLL